MPAYRAWTPRRAASCLQAAHTLQQVAVSHPSKLERRGERAIGFRDCHSLSRAAGSRSSCHGGKRLPPRTAGFLRHLLVSDECHSSVSVHLGPLSSFSASKGACPARALSQDWHSRSGDMSACCRPTTVVCLQQQPSRRSQPTSGGRGVAVWHSATPLAVWRGRLAFHSREQQQWGHGLQPCRVTPFDQAWGPAVDLDVGTTSLLSALVTADPPPSAEVLSLRFSFWLLSLLIRSALPDLPAESVGYAASEPVCCQPLPVHWVPISLALQQTGAATHPLWLLLPIGLCFCHHPRWHLR